MKRRDFLRMGGPSLVALMSSARLNVATANEAPATTRTQFPKLVLICRYSPQKLAFAASAGYEGVVVSVGGSFDPDKLNDSQIDKILETARQARVPSPNLPNNDAQKIRQFG